MIDKKSSYPVILVPGVLGYGDDVKQIGRAHV